MPKVEGYVCEAGCGSTLTVMPSDSIFKHGWFTTYTPVGMPTVYTCSARCNRIAAERLEANEPTNQIGTPT